MLITPASLLVMDNVSGAAPTITYVHHEVHEGDAYIATYVDATMGANEWIAIAFTTPAAPKRIHMFGLFSCKGSAKFEVISAPTLSGGAAETAYNRNQGSSNTTALTNLKYYNSAADTVTGTAIFDMYAWADKREEGGSRDELEFVLAPATNYAYKLTTLAAGGAGHLLLDWYEHTDTL